MTHPIRLRILPTWQTRDFTMDSTSIELFQDLLHREDVRTEQVQVDQVIPLTAKRRGGNQYHDKGVLSMAHAGLNTGGSQFFLVHTRQATAHLDGGHTCFGKVTEGLEVIEQIRQGDTFSVTIDE